MNKKFYITTPIYYPSGRFHIGTAYTTVLADSIKRFHKLKGEDTYMLTGTDEHGQKIEEKAKELGKTPKEYVDEMAAMAKELWKKMDIDYNHFIRTTDSEHEKTVQKIFDHFMEQGDIYKGEYEGWYCVPCETYFTETQLVNGKCPDCGREVKLMKEESYFFNMKKYADRLLKYYEDHPDFVKPAFRKNEMINNFIKPGLEDLCVTRTSFDWGIKVLKDPKHVIYVWVDALTNYLTALGYLSEDDKLFKKYWPADLQVVGKDIARFHLIYWPIFLMALDLPLPKTILVHNWIMMKDGKMSKSKGNVIYADDLVDMFGVDAVRYFVLHEMPFENDGVITWELMVERMNSDLANTLGNLVNRTISMTNKYLGGVTEDKGAAESVDDDLKSFVLSVPKKVEEKMDKLRVADAITEVFTIFKRCNKYIDETEPWVLGKDESKKDRLSTVLYNLIESITIGASLLKSFMPDTTEKILKQLNTTERALEDMDKFGLYESGTKVTDAPEILFMRLDVKEVLAKAEEIQAEQKAAAGAAEEAESDEEVINIEAKPEITFDDFEKMQFQVGEIIACEEVKKSKKLLCSQVKIGSEVKQIVSGIKKHYSAEEMVGKKVMVLVNLKPAKLAGMLLCAEDAEGNLSLMTPEKKMPAGAEIC